MHRINKKGNSYIIAVNFHFYIQQFAFNRHNVMLDFTISSPEPEEFFDKGKFPLNQELILDNILYCNFNTLSKM